VSSINIENKKLRYGVACPYWNKSYERRKI